VKYSANISDEEYAAMEEGYEQARSGRRGMRYPADISPEAYAALEAGYEQGKDEK
jgi:hypothetical protein